MADIPLGDVVQTAPEDAARLGRWALLGSTHFSGPVRVVGRAHVPAGASRISYATRRLFAIAAEETTVLQPLTRGEPSWSKRVGNTIERALEFLLGAPVVPLRATEGLVGDDGRMVARVDGTAMEYVGISPGDEAVLSWADRRVTVRLLLQTEGTALSMEEQLTEKTGFQSRATWADVESRKSTPDHLRVWVSSTARRSLGVPPDTVVRVRRSLPHVLLRNSASATVPSAALVIGALAVPGIPLGVWFGAALFVVIMTAIPLILR